MGLSARADRTQAMETDDARRVARFEGRDEPAKQFGILLVQKPGRAMPHQSDAGPDEIEPDQDSCEQVEEGMAGEEHEHQTDDDAHTRLEVGEDVAPVGDQSDGVGALRRG